MNHKVSPEKHSEKPGLQTHDPMSEAGRKVLAYHFERMLHHEKRVRTGDDSEAIHDMRVASRRLRTLLNLFNDFFGKSALKSQRKMLRRLAEALGEVRDLDVLRIKAEEYLKAHPEITPDGLQPLLSSWQNQFDAAQANLLQLLESEAYQRFIDHFRDFVMTPHKDAVIPDNTGNDAMPYLVCHVVPQLIYQHLGAVRAYEINLSHSSLDRLHNLRISAKRLRYALETFEEVLRSEAKIAITAAKTLQEYLGDLQDARVASATIREYLDTVNDTQPITAILQYQTACETEKDRLLNGIDQAWSSFTDPKIRRALALSLSIL